MSQPRPPESGPRLARQARELFVARVQAGMPALVQAVGRRLQEVSNAVGNPREMQERRDAMMAFDRRSAAWQQGVGAGLRQALLPATATAQVRLKAMTFELVGEEVVERKILSSRLALAVGEKSTWEINDLKLRMQYLEGEDQQPGDILRPEALSLLLLEQWGAAGLSNAGFELVQDTVKGMLLEVVPQAYAELNKFLIGQGVMRDIDLSKRVRRAAAPTASRRGPGAPEGPADAQDSAGWSGAWQGGPAGSAAAGGAAGGFPGGYAGAAGGGPSGGAAGYGGGPAGYAGGAAGHAGGPAGYAGGPAGPGGAAAAGPSAAGWGPGAARGGGFGGAQGGAGAGFPSGPAGAMGAVAAGGFPAGGAGREQQPGGASQGGAAPGDSGGVHEETRLMTSSPPLARVRARATGVLGQLRRLLTDRVAGFSASGGDTAPPISPGLAAALRAQETTQPADAPLDAGSTHPMTRAGDEDTPYDNAAVERVAGDLRRKTGELKKKASTTSEKATIEIVALMFQSILSEERIPPAVRVWFARLQMPVLRVALAEPEFFGTLEHPARLLIDRMGSCVLGFDAASIGGSALEIEIKRVVQVIEQYPETGRRVFQLVYEEFQKFLARYLTEKGATQKVVSVAQQVEQKETLAIQYTIEMRSLLEGMPVPEEIRDFLFKVWAEVLALAAVRHGPQHDETLALKRAASELVWSAGAKPNRTERAQVIQDLPGLLQRLRAGMTLVGIQGEEQEGHIKAIGDTLADAFMSKTEAIPRARVEEMARRLVHLEDYVATDPATDLPLDAESIEMMLGMDASMIEVVADGGSQPSQAMMAWANELQLGTWFSLDHNGRVAQVQYVWRSERGQLHLFAAPGGRSYLVQVKRLAAYLQAGLLLPVEEEALTVRATRDALAKLDANPERLLEA